jgi:6-phosphofructokinase 1
MKTLGLMTSGGDAPGMNAAIRAIVRVARGHRWRVLGFQRGYEGILQEQFQEMDARSVSNIIHRGGTILKTARSREFLTLKGQKRAARNLDKLKVDGLVLVGGNGTFRGAMDLARVWKGKLVGVPGTIDNDLFGTDFTLGFDTAVNTAVQAIDKVRDTADAHDRVFLIEVMGRHSGHIAIAVGFATGAEQILIPEKAANVHTICQRLCAGRSRGKTSSIVVVAEGAVKGGASTIANQLMKLSRNECRVCILGHIQRGGSPTAADRLLGTKLGGYAVDLLARGQTGVMTGEVGGKLVATPLRAAVQHKKKLDHDLLKFHSKLSL